MSLYFGNKQIKRVAVAFPGKSSDSPVGTLSSGDQMLEGVTAYNNGVKYTGTIPTKTESDAVVNGDQVTIPAGYYSSEFSKQVAGAELSVPVLSIDTSGLVTSVVTQTAAGWVNAASKTQTLQLDVQGAMTVAPSESVQTAVNAGKYTTGAITVGAISSSYVGSGVTRKSATVITPQESAQVAVSANTYTTGDITVSAISNTYIGSAITRKSAATYTPTTSDQTISGGQYLSGTQTIKGDSNLVASNILSGVSIFGVNGSVEIHKYYTGDSEPSSSFGNDGDIYLVVG